MRRRGLAGDRGGASRVLMDSLADFSHFKIENYDYRVMLNWENAAKRRLLTRRIQF